MEIGYSREKITNLFLKERKKVLSIGIIIFTLIFSLSIYRGQAAKIGSLSLQKDTEVKKNEVLKEIEQTEKTVKSYKNLFTRRDASLVTNAMSNIAGESNVRLVSIRPGNEENQPLYTKYTFILVVSADNYHAIGKFVSLIESQPETYFVDAISIRPQAESQTQSKESAQAAKPANKLIVNMTLSLIAFKG